MSNFEQLEGRLYGILHCTICQNLPKDAVYQCTNGHLICPGCLTQLLMEADLQGNGATCVRCQSTVSRRNVCRNVVAELVAAELPAACRFCDNQMPRKILERHEHNLCGERIIECRYKGIGCRWRGSYRESEVHEMRCSKPDRSGAEILKTLLEGDQEYQKQMKHYGSVFDLLSTQKIVYQDIQFEYYKTIKLDGLTESDFYETISFSAFRNEWRLEARLRRNPLQPIMTYQLMLDSDQKSPCTVKYLLLQGPYGGFRIQPRIVKFHFTETAHCGPETEVTLSDPSLYSLLVSSQLLNFRMIMFLLTKEEEPGN